ncbi:MAG TPA: sugar phosphate isomerase/epimerase family protein [Bryobacteraceae bacterium]|nr:sugar phosphate isomerase/epimerase family protein [Bryobacteraceae bacterium]
MQALNALEVGVMFWAGGDPYETVRDVKSMGVRGGQLGIPGDLRLEGAAQSWKQALADENFTLATVFAAYNGESYADIPTVQRTVGFVPTATRAERERRTLAVSDFAAELGVGSIATHIGFVPEERSSADYIAVRDMVRRVCDHAAGQGQTFALETGQEPAPVLLAFIADAQRANLRINFDPANMILYGTGDPIDALDILRAHVVSVHCKDGNWPPPASPGALGTEQPLGEGAVGMDRFVAKLKEIGYRGPLTIEREAYDKLQRRRDIMRGVELLCRLAG